MNPVHLLLVKTLNELIKRYDNQESGINYTDVRDFENYIKSKVIDIIKCNKEINK